MNRFITFCLIALLSASAQESTKARTEFLDAVKQMDDSRVRSAADALARSDNREAVDALLDGYGICAQQIKVLWQEKLKHLQEMAQNENFKIDTSTNPPTIPPSDVQKYKAYQSAVKSAQATEAKIMRIEEIKRVIVAALAKFKGDAAVKELVSKLKSESQWTKRAGIAEALGAGTSSADVISALLDRIKNDAEPQVKISSLDALRGLKATGENVLAVALEELKSDYWQIKVTAIALLKSMGSKEARQAVEPLIEALQKADGRLKFEINDALVELSGVDKHADYAAWKAWLEANRDKVKGGDYKAAQDADAKSAGNTTTFYGIPVTSKNVIFILDRSGSMIEPSEWDIPADVSTGTGSQGPEIKKEGDRKIDIARWQLKRTMASLPDGIDFNMIFFSHDYSIMSDKMVKMSSSTRKSAMDFINKLEPIGGTNTFDALERALSFAGAQDKVNKSGVDTIFLLTDGIPNSGQVPNANDIVVKIREINKHKKVKIHTIGIFTTGTGANMMQPNEIEDGTKFLKQLAEDSGGTFISAMKPRGEGKKKK